MVTNKHVRDVIRAMLPYSRVGRLLCKRYRVVVSAHRYSYIDVRSYEVAATIRLRFRLEDTEVSAWGYDWSPVDPISPLEMLAMEADNT